ncbi:Scaffold-type E3 ligase [Didymella pomorum]
MFGASEDRARQLAGRQRWKRISSSGSSSSYRSASSSSQFSQLSHREISYIFEQNPQRPTPIPEHPSPTRFVPVNSLHDLGGLQYLVQPIAASDVEEAFSRMVSKNLHPRTLHQRSQTEHLSHVLFDETATGHASPPPTSPFTVSGLTKPYGVLGWGAKILQQVRHVTEQAPPAQAEGHLSTLVTVHDFTSRSLSSDDVTKTNLNKLFDKYRDNATTEPDLIGPEGSMGYLQELGVDPEGVDCFAASEIVQSPTLGEITREGFVNGWLERDCDTFEKQKSYISNLKAQLPSDKTTFTRVYKYTFFLAKTTQQKAVLLEQAVPCWELLFSSPHSAVKWTSSNTPWLDWWKEFLEVSWKKSVNKDMWNETLKFAQLTLEDEAISFWNEESSWPSVIDDFVEWVKNEKRGGAEQKTEEMEY